MPRVRGQGHRVHLRPGRNRSPGGAGPDARSPHGGALCRGRAAEPPKFKLRRYMDFRGGAKSWNCQRRIVARVEAGPDGVDTRYIVTNLTDRRAQRLYERKYCQRGRMENLLKSFTWPPIGPPAREPAPTKSGSFCMAPPIGCSGRSRASCRSARPGASSTPCATG